MELLNWKVYRKFPSKKKMKGYLKIPLYIICKPNFKQA